MIYCLEQFFFCKFIENIENDSAYQFRYKLANQTFWNIVNSESYNFIKNTTTKSLILAQDER